MNGGGELGQSEIKCDEKGRPILSLSDKIESLEYCIRRGAKEDALGHLFDLISFVAPNYIFKGEDFGFFGIKELQEKYGNPPVPVEMDIQSAIARIWRNHAPAGTDIVMTGRTATVRVEPANTIPGMEKQIEQLNRVKEEAVYNRDFEFAANVRDAVDGIRKHLDEARRKLRNNLEE
jgi:hypothetical protein